MPQVPTNHHDLAIWLLNQLENIALVGNGAWEGVLPSEFDFQEVITALENAPKQLNGVCSEATRTIEFYPETVGVYQTLEAFFTNPANFRTAPSKFSILELPYSSGTDHPTPTIIKNYLDAVKLCKLLSKVADHSSDNGGALHFIKSHESKLEVKLVYQQADLCPLPSLDKFDADFVRSTHHEEPKRNIIRTTLLDIFKGSKSISIAAFFEKFESFFEDVCSSYAMYTSDFSYEKIRTEVEKQNLEDTFRINKTVSDIQNQLLALPAALVLAGAGIQNESNMKNIAIWIGVTIFGWLMWKLITNQQHSIKSISKEINIRQGRLSDQPDAVASRFTDAFNDLNKRATEQMSILQGIRLIVIVIWAVVTVMAYTAVCPNHAETLYQWLTSLELPLSWIDLIEEKIIAMQTMTHFIQCFFYPKSC